VAGFDELAGPVEGEGEGGEQDEGADAGDAEPETGGGGVGGEMSWGSGSLQFLRVSWGRSGRSGG